MSYIVFKDNLTKITLVDENMTYLQSLKTCNSLTHGKLLDLKYIKILKSNFIRLREASKKTLFRVGGTDDFYNLLIKSLNSIDDVSHVCPGDNLYEKSFPFLCQSSADKSSSDGRFNYLYVLIPIGIIIVVNVVFLKKNEIRQQCTDDVQREENVSSFIFICSKSFFKVN